MDLGSLSGSWTTVVLPLLLGAVAAAALVLLGVRLGRRWPVARERRLAAAVRELATGRFRAGQELSEDDSAGELESAVAQLAAALAERARRGTPRATRIGEAIEEIDGLALAIIDRELQIVAAGEGMARLCGGRPRDFEGHPVASILTESSWAALAPRLADAGQRRRGFAARVHLRRAGAEPMELMLVAAEAGDPEIGIVLVFDALSARGERPEELSARLEASLGLLDLAGDGLAVVRQGIVVHLSPAARDWIGAEALGRPLRDLLPAEDLLLALDRVGRAERGEQVDGFTCWLLASQTGAGPRRVEIRPAPYLHQGEPATALCLRARAPRKLTRLQRHEHQARLQAVLQTVADGFLLLVPREDLPSRWQLSLLNPRIAGLLGLEQPPAPGDGEDQLVEALVPRFANPQAAAAFFETWRHQPEREHAALLETGGSAARCLELLARPVILAGDGLVGRVLVLRDVTEVRRRERRLSSSAEQLERSRDSLQRAYEELSTVNRSLEGRAAEMTRINDELRELDRTRGQLLANVSHELQSPLVSIRGYTQMVLEGRLGKITEEQRQGLEVAVRNVDRMVEMISTLLAYARSETAAPAQLEPVDPGPVIEEIIERHREVAAEKGVELSGRVEGEGLLLLSERDALSQVIDNLVANGVKYNHEGGGVEVSVESGAGQNAIITVSDTGRGIPRGEQKQVFDRFYRGSSASGVPGTGIGLATVKNLVERHSGQIELTSEEGRGTTVKLTWPVAGEQSSHAAG